jgi:hypothetical protein
LFVSLVLLLAAAKKENAFKDVALEAGTQQNLSNLYSLDIYGVNPGPFDLFFPTLPPSYSYISFISLILVKIGHQWQLRTSTDLYMSVKITNQFLAKVSNTCYPISYNRSYDADLLFRVFSKCLRLDFFKVDPK